MGAAAVAVVVGCGDDDSDGGETPSSSAGATGTAGATTAAATAAATTAPATAGPTTAPAVACVVTPALTEGPYFVDEKLLRSDITSDPTTGDISEGVPLSFTLTVSNVTDGGCTPIAGAAVDVWHCDALGEYSDVSGGAGQTNTSGMKFLRGYQVTDANGQVVFQTVYPGWYSGRTIHIHFKVRTDPESDSGHEFTSQFFFDEAITDAVMAVAPYNSKGSPDTRNASDNIYLDEMLIALTPEGDGYTGSYHIGVNFA
jgi:protocatechuate 3,4-dioxygenase beta subunit